MTAGYVEPMLLLNDITAQIDVLVGFSCVSANAPIAYTRPMLHEKGKIFLRDLYYFCFIFTNLTEILCRPKLIFKTEI